MPNKSEIVGNIGWKWKARNGAEVTLRYDVASFMPEEIERTRKLAIEDGYPGHSGGWWNYLVDDIHGWFARPAPPSLQDQDHIAGAGKKVEAVRTGGEHG